LTKGVIEVLNLTPHLLESYNVDTDISPEFLKEAKQITFPPPLSEIVFTFKKENLTGSHLTASGKGGNHVTDWKSPILSMGTTTLTFQNGSEHSSHPIEIKPLGVGRRAERFVKDSVMYTWENERFKIENKSLIKAIGSEKVEAAKYKPPQPHPPKKQSVIRRVYWL
jgi:hypothetical protein